MVLCHSESASRPTSLIGSEPLLVVPRLSNRERRCGARLMITPSCTAASHVCIVGAGSCVWWNQFLCASPTGGRGEWTQDHSLICIRDAYKCSKGWFLWFCMLITHWLSTLHLNKHFYKSSFYNAITVYEKHGQILRCVIVLSFISNLCFIT